MENNSELIRALTAIKLESLIYALIFLVIGIVLAKVLSKLCSRFLQNRLAVHQLRLLKRFVYYTTLIIFFVAALQQLNVKLSLFLGAAGIVTVAIGFASQTSVSNIISGLFLITEKPFVIGDTIVLSDGTKGEVLSIDLLSIKLRTVDNLFIRVPNENLIKSQIINTTRFAIRRFDAYLGIGYEQNIDKVKKVLFEVAENNPDALKEPLPSFTFIGFGDSAINIEFSVWAQKENYFLLQNSLQQDIKEAFEKNQINMPFPIRSINFLNPIPSNKSA